MPFDASVPNIARVYEYDKEFVTRAASWAARQGVAQFLDFGAFDITFDGRLSPDGSGTYKISYNEDFTDLSWPAPMRVCSTTTGSACVEAARERIV